MLCPCGLIWHQQRLLTHTHPSPFLPNNACLRLDRDMPSQRAYLYPPFWTFCPILTPDPVFPPDNFFDWRVRKRVFLCIILLKAGNKAEIIFLTHEKILIVLYMICGFMSSTTWADDYGFIEDHNLNNFPYGSEWTLYAQTRFWQ